MRPPSAGHTWFRTTEGALVQLTPKQLESILARMAADGVRGPACALLLACELLH